MLKLCLSLCLYCKRAPVTSLFAPMCFYVNVHASVMYALWKLTAGGQRRRQFTAANMKEFS